MAGQAGDLRRTVAAQAGYRHAMDIAGGGKRMGVEISVRVQPQHPQFLAGVAAMARHRADRADAQAVVAAQQDGQLALAQFGMHRVVHRAVPGGHFRQMAVAVDGRLPGIGRAIQIAAVLDLEALGLDDRTQAGDAQGFRSHGGRARRRRCRWALRSARCRAAGKGWSAWRFSARGGLRKGKTESGGGWSRRRPSAGLAGLVDTS